jgi:RNase P/RNase MRP subunit p29
MAWTAPKVDWTAADGVADTHLNNIGNDLLYIKTDHMDLTTGIHGAVSAATANALMARDAYGRAKVVAPSATDDIAIKSTVDDEGLARTAADTALQAQITALGTGPFLPIAGGTMTGSVYGHVGTDYTTGRFRNVFLSTAAPTTEGANGDIWIQYEL